MPPRIFGRTPDPVKQTGYCGSHGAAALEGFGSAVVGKRIFWTIVLDRLNCGLQAF